MLSTAPRPPPLATYEWNEFALLTGGCRYAYNTCFGGRRVQPMATAILHSQQCSLRAGWVHPRSRRRRVWLRYGRCLAGPSRLRRFIKAPLLSSPLLTLFIVAARACVVSYGTYDLAAALVLTGTQQRRVAVRSACSENKLQYHIHCHTYLPTCTTTKLITKSSPSIERARGVPRESELRWLGPHQRCG